MSKIVFAEHLPVSSKVRFQYLEEPPKNGAGWAATHEDGGRTRGERGLRARTPDVSYSAAARASRGAVRVRVARVLWPEELSERTQRAAQSPCHRRGCADQLRAGTRGCAARAGRRPGGADARAGSSGEVTFPQLLLLSWLSAVDIGAVQGKGDLHRLRARRDLPAARFSLQL